MSNEAKRPDLIVLHPLSRVPDIEFQENIYARDGEVYIVPGKHEGAYRISKTDEQFKEYIEKLERMLDDEKKKIAAIYKALWEILDPNARMQNEFEKRIDGEYDDE